MNIDFDSLPDMYHVVDISYNYLLKKKRQTILVAHIGGIIYFVKHEGQWIYSYKCFKVNDIKIDTVTGLMDHLNSIEHLLIEKESFEMVHRTRKISKKTILVDIFTNNL
jgi:hypothetical protein